MVRRQDRELITKIQGLLELMDTHGGRDGDLQPANKIIVAYDIGLRGTCNPPRIDSRNRLPELPEHLA